MGALPGGKRLWSSATSRRSRSTRFPSIKLKEKLVDITAVEVIDDYRLRLTFEDAVVGDVSFVDRDWRGVFEPFHDPAVFA